MGGFFGPGLEVAQVTAVLVPRPNLSHMPHPPPGRLGKVAACVQEEDTDGASGQVLVPGLKLQGQKGQDRGPGLAELGASGR